jgi:hypothetical protein
MVPDRRGAARLAGRSLYRKIGNMNRRFVMKGFSWAASCLFLVGVALSTFAQTGDSPNSTVAKSETTRNRSSPALSLARDYLKGMEAGNMDALDALFLPNERSSVLENASDEGSWEHYRDHHLAPELKETPDFKFTVEKEAEDRFGSTAVVRQIGRFVGKVGEETRAYRAAITYVVVNEADAPKIAHLHWSSRPERK